MVMEQENQVTPKLHQGQGTRQSGGSRQRKHPNMPVTATCWDVTELRKAEDRGSAA